MKKYLLILLFSVLSAFAWGADKVVLGFNLDPSLPTYIFPCLQSSTLNMISCYKDDIRIADVSCEKSLKVTITLSKTAEVSCYDMKGSLKVLGFAQGEAKLDETSGDGLSGIDFYFKDSYLEGRVLYLK